VSAMPDLITFAPLLLGAGLLLSLFQVANQAPSLVRALASALCVVLCGRYIWWRYAYAMPVGQEPWQQIWAWIFFVFESLAILSSMTVLLFMSRHRDRSQEVRKHLQSPTLCAPVDVFIATYNESYDVLERTIVGATSIDHRDLRVWVLDDGARDWVRELAKQLGAEYVCRIKGKHAKAGNVNNGLQHALAHGRPPQFLLLLDADFVPHRNILKRTLGFFEDANVGIVQTPQHFFNPDPIQRNLLARRHWPDEQRFFFNTLLACKDAWGAAYCCGTSAVFRVEALVRAGGMATETVTEDMLTTFKLDEHGYRTIFLNEMLSMGLAPEGLQEYVAQRARWCLGAIQQIYTRWSFAGPARFSLINRLSLFDGIAYWVSNSAFKLMMISGPLVYWWTGTAVISATMNDLIYWLGPSAVCQVIYMSFYARKRILPVMTDVSQLLSSVAIVRTVATGLVRPFGHPFKVTAKGISTDKTTVQWNLLLPFAALALATALGIAINTSHYSPLYGTDGYSVNVFWSLFNIAVLTIACLICIELPRPKDHQRFSTKETATLLLATGERLPCRLRDISLGGANVALTSFDLAPGKSGFLEFDNGLLAPILTLGPLPGGLAVKFSKDEVTRRKLIVKLFTGGYDNEVREINLKRVLMKITERMFA
jgi:cellulose synthase (UDP-forming)